MYALSIASATLAAPPHLISEPHPYAPNWPQVHNLLSTKCIGCHRPGTDRVDLSTYASLLDARSEDELAVVVPYDPSTSLLWEYLCWNALADGDSDLPDSPMMPPQQHEWLSAGQLAALYDWIKNGALQYVLPDTCDNRPVTELDFPRAKACAQCHPRQYDEWASSMHAYAMHSPVFEAFNLTLQERTSGTIGTFCTRCHAPIGTSLGESGSRRLVNRSRISMEGVTCIVCHRRSTGHYKSNGRLPIEPGQTLSACVYGPFESSVSQQVGSHISQPRPYIKSSQFCGECHDVVTPTGVRNEEAFSEWQRSPAAQAGIHCQQCHMGPVQGIPVPDEQRPLGYAAEVPQLDQNKLPLRRLTDHSFAGPDYSLLPDTEFPQKLDWMYEVDYRDTSRLTPHQQATLRNLRRKNRTSLRRASEKRLQLLCNAARLRVEHPKSASPASEISIEVAVESLFGGHHFPTGFSAERQVWVSVELRDETGRPLFRSGDLDHNHDLRDDHSHEVLTRKVPYDRDLLSFQNKFTALTNRGTERSVTLPINRHLRPLSIVRPSSGVAASFGRAPGFRIAKGSLPPLKSIGQRYRVSLPEHGQTCTVCVRLNFRHLPPGLLDHIGTPHLKQLLEIVVLDEYCGSISLENPSDAGPRNLLRFLGALR